MPFTYDIQNDTLLIDNIIELGGSQPKVSVSTDNIMTISGQLIEDGSVSKRMIISNLGNLTVRSAAETYYNPISQAWAARVVANGGAPPSLNTKIALSTFATGLDSAELTSMMIAVNCFVPDSLIASITPLIKVVGNDPWTNANFIAGDLTIDGLKGNASNKWLNTGVSPSDAAYGGINASITAYMMSNTYTNYRCEVGSYNNSTSTSRLYLPYNISPDRVLFSSWGGPEAGAGYIVPLMLTGNKGYYSCNRTSATFYGVYSANSSTAHSLIGSGGDNYHSNPYPTTPYGVFAAAGYGDYSDKRLSFVALHKGLSAAQSSTFYGLVQAMRVSLGGGYV